MSAGKGSLWGPLPIILGPWPWGSRSRVQLSLQSSPPLLAALPQLGAEGNTGESFTGQIFAEHRMCGGQWGEDPAGRAGQPLTSHTSRSCTSPRHNFSHHTSLETIFFCRKKQENPKLQREDGIGWDWPWWQGRSCPPQDPPPPPPSCLPEASTSLTLVSVPTSLSPSLLAPYHLCTTPHLGVSLSCSDGWVPT